MRYVARQPIFDRSAVVVGYELLYRRSASGPAGVTDEGQATFSVLYDALVTFGLDSTLDQTRGWVNVTPAVLEQGGHRLVSPDRVVLEILEDAEPTPEPVNLLAAVRGEGFTVALDDFVLGGSHDALLDLVDIVKFELPTIPPGRLAADAATPLPAAALPATPLPPTPLPVTPRAATPSPSDAAGVSSGA